MKRRRWLGMEVWRELVARHASSGLTVRAFCVQESVSVSGFYRWRGLLSANGDAGPRGLVASKSTKRGAADTVGVAAQRPSEADFIDLGALAERRGGRPIEVRLDLGSGVRLHLVCG